ncbi:hypothetical protein [Nonomuraea sp. NPDC049141]|uniref:TetR/AcrR family transcriptional regulator n=1 Tax=Nonomuraea sp. NPDC049141 TaxID=3155500 RepID=UPI0033D23FC5
MPPHPTRRRRRRRRRRQPDRDRALRAGMVNVQILGLSVARYIVRLEPIASASTDELVACLGPIVQQCLTGQGATP